MARWGSSSGAPSISPGRSNLFQQHFSSSSIVRFLLKTSPHTAQLKYGHITNFLADDVQTISISKVTPTRLTNLHQSFQKIGIQLEEGWPVPLQRMNNCHIADLPGWGKLSLSNHLWKLFREMFISLQVTLISDITTACGGYFTPAASRVTPSYPSVFQWLQQQHNITSEHKTLFTQILAANITICSYKLSQPLGAWITKPTTIRKYCKPRVVDYSRNALGQ